MIERNALVGYTGFVGGNILNQYPKFPYLFRSTNIETMHGRDFDLVVCAGAPGVKWKANKFPDEDWSSIKKLISSLKSIKAKEFVLISTIAVYPHPAGSDENTTINLELLNPYGKHRRMLELEVRRMFPHANIIRLPGIFGPGLKKNLIFDLLNKDFSFLMNSDGIVQFYDLNNLWKDLQVIRTNHISLTNIATEPMTIKTLAMQGFGHNYVGNPEAEKVLDDFRTLHAHWWNRQGSYLYSSAETIASLKSLINLFSQSSR